MIAKFIEHNKIIEISNCTPLELEQLEIESNIEWWVWKGKKREKRFKNYLFNYKYLPGGFWHKLLKLTKKGLNVDFIDIRNFVRDIKIEDLEEWLENVPLANGYYPYDYQLYATYLAIKFRISRGQYATGAGKTFIFYLITRYLLEKLNCRKVLIVVPAVSLVTQTKDEFLLEYQSDEFISVDPIYGGSKRNRDANVVIGNIDSLLHQDIEFFEQFDAVLYDEGHKLSTAGYKTIYEYLTNNDLKLVFGASGTFNPPDSPEEWDAESIAGPILKKIFAHELIEKGVLTPVKIVSITFDYDEATSLAYYNLPSINNIEKKNSIEMNYIRNIHKRMEYIGSLVKNIEFNQLLLFKSVAYAKKYVQYLSELCPDKQVHLIVGEISQEQREYIKKLTEQNFNVIIVATYGTMSTGVSIKNLSTLHFVEGAKSFIWVLQSIGRLLRLHPSKKLAMVFDYTDKFKRPKFGVDDSVKIWKTISLSHLRTRLKIYANQKFPVIAKIVKL